jgi:hypothetical protein
MFHQANLRQADLTDETTTTVGPTRPLSTRNGGKGSTPSAQTGRLSLLAAWVETVVAGFNQYATWPLVSYKLDKVAQLLADRVVRDKCHVVVEAVSGNGKGFTGLNLVAKGGNCVYPVTFPVGVNLSAFKSVPVGSVVEKVGHDGMIVWVSLKKGKAVGFVFKAPWSF